MMTKNRAYPIAGYAFSNTDNLLFDANIWLYIYGPQGNPRDWKTQIYSNALANALRANSTLHIDVLILSEFINRFARFEYDLRVRTGASPNNFKAFRDSPLFQPIAFVIANVSRRILGHCSRTDNGFEIVDITTLLIEYEQGKSDFNDQILTALCINKGFVFVTHDADFKDKGLTVITANNNLLV